MEGTEPDADALDRVTDLGHPLAPQAALDVVVRARPPPPSLAPRDATRHGLLGMDLSEESGEKERGTGEGGRGLFLSIHSEWRREFHIEITGGGFFEWRHCFPNF